MLSQVLSGRIPRPYRLKHTLAVCFDQKEAQQFLFRAGANARTSSVARTALAKKSCQCSSSQYYREARKRERRRQEVGTSNKCVLEGNSHRVNVRAHACRCLRVSTGSRRWCKQSWVKYAVFGPANHDAFHRNATCSLNHAAGCAAGSAEPEQVPMAALNEQTQEQDQSASQNTGREQLNEADPLNNFRQL